MGRVIGVGGVFLNFQGEDQEIRDWYGRVLELKMSPYGTNFIEGDQLTLVSFKHSNKDGVPYINFRVDNIEEVLQSVTLEGCTVTSTIEEYSYGKFAQFEDPFGNYIELWEPNIDEYIKMVEKEINEYKQKKSNQND